MSKAAEDAVGWAAFQSKLGIAGFIAVLLSLIFTGWAAVAAARAAKSAQKSADLQERAFKGIERPYLIPGPMGRITFKPVGFTKLPQLHCVLGNYGRTPAIIHYIRSSFGPEPLNHFSDPDSPIKTIENTFNSGRVIPANTVDDRPFEVIIPAVVTVDHGERGRNKVAYKGDYNSVFVVINTKFEDTLGVIREGRFTWVYDNTRHRFLRYGGKQYNYERETPVS